MKPVIVTVDVEGHVGNEPVRRLIFGETDSGRFGIEYIMDVFDKVQAKVLFFVDFAEAWDYGRHEIEKVVRTILVRGHYVGVHIHPDHMADKDRAFLWQYSREEQYDIIKKCTDLYVEITGTKPKSFRAGKYGANRDTLDILCELGYQYDFSQFYHQKWCGITPPLTINAPCRYKSIVEFPVTMHKSVHLGKLVREDKIDIEQMTSGELQYAFLQIMNQQFGNVTTLFLHSFSMLKWFQNPDAPEKDEGKIRKLHLAAEFVAKASELHYIAEDDLDTVTVNNDIAMRSEIVWKSNLKGMFYTYQKAKQIANRNKKARMLIRTVRFGGLVLTAMIIAFLFYR